MGRTFQKLRPFADRQKAGLVSRDLYQSSQVLQMCTETLRDFARRVVFEDKAAGGNVNGQININCVNVAGTTATLSGLVTHSNNKALIGQEGVFRIVDNGSRGTDEASLINFHQPGTSTDCNAGEFDLTRVKGNFTVR